MAELEPLYTAEEMRAAEAGHDVDAMMQRAGAAVAEELMRRFPDAPPDRDFTRAAARTAATGASPREILRAQGRELVDDAAGRRDRRAPRHRAEGRAARRDRAA